MKKKTQLVLIHFSNRYNEHVLNSFTTQDVFINLHNINNIVRVSFLDNIENNAKKAFKAAINRDNHPRFTILILS